MLVGVLSLQGAVEEHINCLHKVGCNTREVKTSTDLKDLDGIIIPGGESTTMAIVGERNGIFSSLRDWVHNGRPTWGTCAGMILLSDHAIKQSIGGQSLLGGLDVHVCRNYFGSQLNSCKKIIDVTADEFIGSEGIFIRAPAILKAGAGVRILGTVLAEPHSSAVKDVKNLICNDTATTSTNTDNSTVPATTPSGEYTTTTTTLQQSTGSVYIAHTSDNETTTGILYQVAVAVRQENILATAFHPELTNDLRWHRYFVEMIHRSKE